MKTENVAESHQTDIPYTFPAGHETTIIWLIVSHLMYIVHTITNKVRSYSNHIIHSVCSYIKHS